MIKTDLIGRLGKDCSVNSPNGKQVINFSVAIDIGYGDKKSTLWAECAYWTDKGNIANFLKKGTQVFVSGEPAVRTYQTNDGKTGASLTVRVFSVQLLGGKQETQQQAAPAQQTTANNYSDEDLAF